MSSMEMLLIWILIWMFVIKVKHLFGNIIEFSWQHRFRFALPFYALAALYLQSDFLKVNLIPVCLHSKSKHWKFHQLGNFWFELFPTINASDLLVEIILLMKVIENIQGFSIFLFTLWEFKQNFLLLLFIIQKPVKWVWFNNKWYNCLLHPLKVFLDINFNLFI